MTNLKALIDALRGLVTALAGVFLYRQGKKAEKLNTLEKQAEIDEKARKIQDRVDDDPEYRKRLQDHFNE